MHLTIFTMILMSLPGIRSPPRRRRNTPAPRKKPETVVQAIRSGVPLRSLLRKHGLREVMDAKLVHVSELLGAGVPEKKLLAHGVTQQAIDYAKSHEHRRQKKLSAALRQ